MSTKKQHTWHITYRGSRFRKWHVPSLLIVVLALFSGISSPVQAASTEGIELEIGDLTISEDLVGAILTELAGHAHTDFPGTRFKAIYFAKEQSWAYIALASLNGPDADPEHIGAGAAGRKVIAVRNEHGEWTIGMEKSDTFEILVLSSPDTLISPAAKLLLTGESASTIADYKFPWVIGQTRNWSQGWHGSSCSTPCAIDLQVTGITASTDLRVLAASDGLVTKVCATGTVSVNIEINNGGNVTEYFHLNKATFNFGNFIVNQTTVKQGQELGTLLPGTWSDNCGVTIGQSNTTAHLHWALYNNPITVDGWYFKSPNCATQGSQTKCPGAIFTSTNAVTIGTQPPQIQQVFLSNGQKFLSAGVWRSSNPGIEGFFYTGDFNGDDKTDIMRT